jgi:ribonuclease P protein component
VRAGCLEVRVAASLHALPRVGLIVPKYKHSSVDRNRLKRRLREWVRLDLLPALAGITPVLDLTVRTSPSAYTRSFAELGRDVQQVARQLRRVASALVVPALVVPASEAVATPESPMPPNP